MEGTYPVSYRGETVGSVVLRRCGLYYELCCRCQPAGEKMLQLILMGTDQTENIGLLIPHNGRLELTKRIPAKRLGEGSASFYLRCRREEDALFYAVEPERSVSFLHRLDDCFFAVRNGKTGIILRSENNGEKDEIYT